MKATNFSEDMIPQINEVLKFVLENRYSDFYRKKYGENPDFYPVKSYEDFQKIPVLEKDEILEVHWKERLFVAEDNVETLSFSSGTTNINKMMITPRLRQRKIDNYNKDISEEEIIKSGAKTIMTLSSPTSPAFRRYLRMKTKKLLIVPGNVYNLSLSARIAKEAEIQGLSTTPTVLTYFIEHLRKNDFDFNEIKWVYLGGEYCSKKMSELFRKTFPKAKLKFRFKSSEIGVMRGWRCLELDKEIDPNKFHPSKVSLTEVENEREKISTEGKSGNLLHTDLFIKAFPLIRYRTNDIGSLQNSKCKCGEEQLLLLGGRFNFDILRFQGVILRSTSIEKALEKVSNYLKPHYEMHVFEENIGGKIKPKLKLFVSMRENYKKNIENPLLIEEISRKISANLRLSAKSTLEDLVIKGYFLPLEISLVEKWKEDKQKSKKIISHLA